MTELHAILKGRVQMVMMRDYVQRKASALGLTGTVQNLQDGSVEVVAHGPQHSLETLAEKLHKGSVLSRVDEVSIEFRIPNETFADFHIKYA